MDLSGPDSIKNAGGVPVLFLCTSSDGGRWWFIFVQIFMKIFSTELKL